MLVDPDTGVGWSGWGVSEMEGVVPRRRDSLGESRVLVDGRSMSPKGRGRGRRKGGSRGTGEDEVVEFTFLRFRRIRDGVWSRTRTDTRRVRGISSYINAAWLLPTEGRDITAVGVTVIRRLFDTHNPAVINMLKRADAQG